MAKRPIESRVSDLAEVMEERGPAWVRDAEALREKHNVPEFEELPATPDTHTSLADIPDPLPVFWDGKPGTLNHGMVCREGKLSVAVSLIVPCINGTVILGTAIAPDGNGMNVHVTNPLKHPLADVADENKRRELWEYDQL